MERALDGNGWSMLVYPEERAPESAVQEVGWVLGPLWVCAESLIPTRVNNPDVSILFIITMPTMLFWPPYKMCRHSNEVIINMFKYASGRQKETNWIMEVQYKVNW